MIKEYSKKQKERLLRAIKYLNKYIEIRKKRGWEYNDWEKSKNYLLNELEKKKSKIEPGISQTCSANLFSLILVLNNRFKNGFTLEELFYIIKNL